MTLKLSTGLRNAMAGTVGFAGALANGVIEIRSGVQPATADAAATGVLLGLVTVEAGAFVPGQAANGLNWAAAAGGGVAKTAVNWKFLGLAAGVATWFRFRGNPADAGAASGTLARMDGSLAVSGGDASVTSTSIEVGAVNTVDVASFAVPTL